MSLGFIEYKKLKKLIMSIFKSKESIGILFAILAYFSFSLLDATQKTLVIYYSVFQLLLIKYFCIEILTYDNFSRVNKKKIISFFKKNKYQLKYISQVNYIFKKNKQ